MARPPNYGFEKRRKELERKAKKEARREERRQRGAQGGDETDATPIDGAPVDAPITEPGDEKP